MPSSLIRAGVVTLVLFAAALLTYRLHAGMPLSEPEATTRAIFTEAAAGNLDGFHTACTAEFYAEFVRVFGEQRFQRVQTLYGHVHQLGLRDWEVVRQQADYRAREALFQLRGRVQSLGQEEFLKLGPEQRMQIIDQGEREKFIFDRGLGALRPEDRNLITDVEGFRSGQRLEVDDTLAWEHAMADDKSQLGSPAALARAETPEKLAFIDRMGLAHLRPQDRAEIGDIKRAELENAPAFKFKYGEPLAREFLARKRVPAGISLKSCQFPRADSRGGLLRGTDSTCIVQAALPDQTSLPITVSLRKTGAQWLVSGMEPALYMVRW